MKPDDKPLDLKKLAPVTPQDIQAGVQWWKRNAPAKFKELIEATPETDL